MLGGSLVRLNPERDTPSRLRTMDRTVTIAALVLLLSGFVRADDLKLKDGSKVSGSIVGFDDNSFKVQTSYGFALVRKDQVVSITVSPATNHEPKKEQASPATDADAKAKATESEGKPQGAAPTAAAVPQLKPKAVAELPPPAIPTQTGGTAMAAVASPPPSLVQPTPEPIRDEVDGSTYINDTYRFRMYKPPDWQVIEGASSLMPGTIAAMGTNDQTTYLLIGEAPEGKSLANDIDATDQRLQNIMGNFRPLGQSHINVGGAQAIQQKFRGGVDDKDWSGTVVFVPHGTQLYTIFGMTVAASDLVQIQENVIARTIASLQFAQ
jgi:hypothetical protein